MASTHQCEADKTEERRDLWTIFLLPDAKGSFSNGLPTLCGELHKAGHRYCSTQGDAAFTPPYDRRLKADQESPEVYGRNKRPVAEGEAINDADIDADKKDRKSVTGGYVSVDVHCNINCGHSFLGIRELIWEMSVACGILSELRVDRQDALKWLEGIKASSKVKHIDVP
ncbi:Polyprotein [Phytophthora palmivora]|uniref:Polyprotein n=1 Tax=Phytophthora palmivora TaxID=4796 RepID=A0A2P4XGP7_9STRA|nr:Polyprotein [Phytophthora palmivora]